MDTGMIINLIITGIIGLFVVFGMYWGLVRGLRRTAIRSLWLLITAGILMLFLSGVITNALINMEFNLTIGNTTVHSLEELITYYIGETEVDLSALGDSLEIVIKTIISYIAIFLNSIMFVILFWLLKIILLPVNWALSKWVFLSKKERQYKRDLKAYKKYKKEYKKLNKGAKKVEVMGFASNDDELLEGEAKEIKQRRTKPGSLAKARKSFDDLVKRTAQLKTHNSPEEQYIEENELLNKPYQEEKVEVEVIEEEFVPQEEYKPEVKEEKKVELEVVLKPKKPKKHRFAGMLLGGVMGLFVGAITLSPVIGIISLAQDINRDNEIALEDKTKVGLLDYVTDGMFGELNDYYNNAIGTNILKYTGTQWVATTAFNTLTRSNIDGVSVDFAKDAKAIIAVVNEVNKLSENLTEAEKNNYPVAKMGEIVNSLDTVVDELFKISIIEMLTPHLIDLCSNMIKAEVENTPATTADQLEINTNNLLLQISDSLAKVDNANNLKQELKALVNIVRILNNGISYESNGTVVTTSLLSEIAKQSLDNAETDMFGTIQRLNFEYNKMHNEMYFTHLINSFYKYNDYEPQVATSVLPTCMDYLLKLLLYELDMKAVADTMDITDGTKVKNVIVTTFDEVFKILLQFNTTYDSNNEAVYREFTGDNITEITLNELNVNIFKSLGKILDSFVTLVDVDTYKEILDNVSTSLSDNLKEMFADIIVKEDANILAGNIKNAINGFEYGAQFEQEFTALGVMFNYLVVGDSIEVDGELEQVKPLLGGDVSLDDLSDAKFEIANFSSLGSVLDSMQNLQIFNYKAENSKYNNMSFFFNSLLSKTKSDMWADVLEEDADTTKDQNGYVVSVKNPNSVVHNILNRIQANFNNNLDDVGAFPWDESFSNMDVFFNFIEEFITEMGKENNTLFELGNTQASVLSLITSSKYTIKQDVATDGGNVVVDYGPLDVISDKKLFKGVLSKAFEDLKGVTSDMFGVEDGENMDIDVKGLIEEVLNNFKSIEVGNKNRPHANYHAHLTALNSALDELYADGSNKIDVESADGVARIGKFLDKLTTSGSDGVRLISDNKIKDILKSLIDSINTELEESISNENIQKPISNLFTAVKNNLDSVKNADTSWETIFGALYNISNTSFDNMDDSTAALSSLGEVLDKLSGRPFKLQETDTNTVAIKFVTDLDVAKALIGIVGNTIGSDASLDTNIKNIIFAVNSNNADTLSALVNTPSGEDSYFVTYDKDSNNANLDFAGVLDILYTKANANSITSWQTLCTNLSSLTEIKNTELGEFAYDADAEIKYLYNMNKVQVTKDGVEKELSDILKQTDTLLTIEQVKYLLKSQINVDANAKSYIKDVTYTIKNNINNLTKDNIDKEIKSVNYFLSFSKNLNLSTIETNHADTDVSLTEMGIYMDELNSSELFEGVGETIAKGVVNTIYDNNDTDFSDVRGQIANVNGQINSYLGTTNQTYFLKQSNLISRIEAIYTQNNPNQTMFGSLQSLKNMLNDDATTFEATINLNDNSAIETARSVLIEMSGILTQLQDNVLVGSLDTRNIAISIISQLVVAIDGFYSTLQYKYTTNVCTIPSVEVSNNHYVGDTGYYKYLKDRIETNSEGETYVDKDGDTYSVPTFIVTEGEDKEAQTNNNLADKKYILVKVFDDAYNIFVSTIKDKMTQN